MPPIKTVIYLDVLLLTNFALTLLFLLAAGLLCGACCSPLRLVGGAGAAAVSSLALLAPTAPWPLAFTYKGMSAALCVAAAYGWQGARNTARLTAWFVLLNLTLTGALFLPGAACNNLSFYLPVSPGLLLASTAGVCGVVEGVLHVLGRSGPACFGADRWPDDPARLPDRRRAGAARPAAPPLAMTPRTPPGAGPMTTARPPPRP